jgi:hypothetical protein
MHPVREKTPVKTLVKTPEKTETLEKTPQKTPDAVVDPLRPGPEPSFAKVAPPRANRGALSRPGEIASGEPAAERDDGAQAVPDRRFLLVGVVPAKVVDAS